jgi:type IV secretory pathway TrbL component
VAVVAVGVEILLVLVVLVAVVLELWAELRVLALQTLAVVAVVKRKMLVHQVVAALVSLFFRFQHHDTQAQPQVHPQSLHQVQTQF